MTLAQYRDFEEESVPYDIITEPLRLCWSNSKTKEDAISNKTLYSGINAYIDIAAIKGCYVGGIVPQVFPPLNRYEGLMGQEGIYVFGVAVRAAGVRGDEIFIELFWQGSLDSVFARQVRQMPDGSFVSYDDASAAHSL